MREVADVVGSRAGKKIKVWAVPSAVARTAGAVTGRFMPLIADMAAMSCWFETGRYVADPRRQEELFGPVPSRGNPRPLHRRAAHRTAPVTDHSSPSRRPSA